jgi:hypothetical protein
MKKLILTLGAIVALVGAPILTAPAANAATTATVAVQKAPQKVALQVVPVAGGYLVSWSKPKHAPKGLRYRITFQYDSGNIGFAYSTPVAKGANYFVLTPKLTQTASDTIPAGKWLVSVRGYTTKQAFVVVGAKHFSIPANCGSPAVGGGLMHPMYCILPPVR